MEPAGFATLAILDALLEEASVSGAARRVGLSTPAVSRALAKLRVGLGDPLLVRAGRTMVLTPKAQRGHASPRRSRPRGASSPTTSFSIQRS